ncbi:MAG: SpoIIE family protein phosphatase [Janthinobacterium lividum]
METTVELSDQSGIAQARRSSLALAQSLGLPEKSLANVALVVTEAATNILKYAGHGQIVLKRFLHGNDRGLAIIALDRGPGIPNLEAARRDGFSTGGSLGAGLGTIERHSDLFDIYSLDNMGTALVACISASKPGERNLANKSHWTIGALSTPKQGQEICGDAWSTRESNGRLSVTLLDGLGHGPLAADAAGMAVDVFQKAADGETPGDTLRRANAQLKATRGAVMAVAKLDPAANSLTFAGVGNIVAVVATNDATQHLISSDGTVGYNMRLVRESKVDWTPRSVFIATTDGLSTRWNLNRHPKLLQRHPLLIAHVLHRDFARDADDASVVVVKAA